jgi:peptide/nickel transport system ATP-binding protein
LDNPILELENVSVFYPGQRLLFKKPRLIQVLHSINLALYRGEILAIVGESGSGKSTLGKSIVGLIDNFNGNYI